ncbi:MAG: hypothetical protein V1678_00555 [Candidatus Aenigmatarchaeota archaeon]
MKSESLINISDDKRKEIVDEVHNNFETKKEFCSRQNLSYPKFRLFINGANISIEDFTKICDFLGIPVEKAEKCITLLKYRSAGFFIKNPKLPFVFKSMPGVRIIADILTDGCVCKHSVQYSNKKFSLIRMFVADLETVFGSFKYRIRRDKNQVYTAFAPVIIGYVLEALGMESGRKAITDPEVPKFIGSGELAAEFLGYVIANDGCVDHVKHTGVRRIRIATATLHDTPPKFLTNCKSLFETLGIRCRLVFRRYKKQKNNEVSKIWEIEISDKRNLEIAGKKIRIPLKYKQDRLQKIIKSYKQLGKGELYELVKHTCMQFAENGHPINISTLSKELERDRETVREITVKLENDDFLIRVSNLGSIPIHYGVKND